MGRGLIELEQDLGQALSSQGMEGETRGVQAAGILHKFDCLYSKLKSFFQSV